MKKTRGLSLIIAFIMLLSVSSNVFAFDEYSELESPVANNVSQIIGDGNTVIFIDVPLDYWAKDQINYFAQQGIVDGYEDGTFNPEGGVTREEFCKLLVSTFKAPLEIPNSPSFADVNEDRWSYGYVEVCKDFLTGYANPFGGLPSFHPEEYATREDIAVALVRMMGFTDKDCYDKGYAGWKFLDGANISPNLLPYVSLACEQGLISGYPDGTFGPMQGITRAETVVLLNRATKQAVTNINAELEMTANVLYSKDGKTATINIIAEEGTTVTVNGETVKMSSNYYDEYEGNFVYKFEEEGTKKFDVEGKKGGKRKSVEVTAKYEIPAPTLIVDQGNQTVTDKDFRLSGRVTDANYSVDVTVNGESVSVETWNNGRWSKTFELEEGENKFEVVAANEKGKQTTKTVIITLEIGAPEIFFVNCPKETTKPTVTIKGRIEGNNDGAMLFIDDEEVDLNYQNEFSETVELKEGKNKFTFRAVNDYGKEETITKTITYAPEVEEEEPEETQEQEESEEIVSEEIVQTDSSDNVEKTESVPDKDESENDVIDKTEETNSDEE